jgi:hypothetical protein
MEPKIEKTNLEQLIDLNAKFGMNGVSDAQDVMNEILTFLPEGSDNPVYNFNYTDKDNYGKLFNAGADSIHAMFLEEFEKSFN